MIQKHLQLNFWEFISTFKYHISTLSSKLSKSLHFLRAAKNIVTTSALKSVYYSLLHSHFIHGIQVWSSTATSNFKCLYIKQKTDIRHINCAKYNSHSEPLFKISCVLPLPKLVEFFKLQFFHNFVIKSYQRPLPTSGQEIKKEDLFKLSWKTIWPTPSLRQDRKISIFLLSTSMELISVWKH